MNYLEDALKKLGKEELFPISNGLVSSCFQFMKPEVIEYKPMESLKIKFPVEKIYLNPRLSMQGGFIAAAFDNAFGLLCFISSYNQGASLDLDTNFHKPIYENDDLTITVYLKHKGNTVISMYGEGFNKNEELISTATTNMIFLK